MSCAGSPGRTRTITKTSVRTVNSVTNARAMRRARNANMLDQYLHAPTSQRSFQSREKQGRRKRGSSRAQLTYGRRLIDKMSVLCDRRREIERALQFIAEIESVLPCPQLELLVDGYAAYSLDDRCLRSLPELLLFGWVGFDARCANVIVGDVAMREVRHRRGRA